MAKSPYHVHNPDGTEDEEGQELEGAVESARKDPSVAPYRPTTPVRPNRDDNSPDGEEG
jgi:hypothetical protein